MLHAWGRLLFLYHPNSRPSLPFDVTEGSPHAPPCSFRPRSSYSPLVVALASALCSLCSWNDDQHLSKEQVVWGVHCPCPKPEFRLLIPLVLLGPVCSGSYNFTKVTEENQNNGKQFQIGYQMSLLLQFMVVLFLCSNLIEV